MAAKLPPATLLYTETQNFHSARMGDDYLISTWFPPDYPKEGQVYPVIYLLDAEVMLGLVSSIVTGMIWDQVFPNCLIIGVGHAVSTHAEWAKLRDVDFTPEEDPDVQPPKRAADFLSFIKNELIPFVEKTYPADPADRCLGGYSGSGEFALYTLLHDPELFQRYFIGSAIWPSMLPHYLSYEEQLAGRRKSLPVRAFFSVGELEEDQLPCLHPFMAALTRRNYEGFHLDWKVIEGAKHATAGPIAVSLGFRQLYKP